MFQDLIPANIGGRTSDSARTKNELGNAEIQEDPDRESRGDSLSHHMVL